jgi:hypothetical protein
MHADQTNTIPVMIRGERVTSTSIAKILGVIIDTEHSNQGSLCCYSIVAATDGITLTARRLFETTVTLVLDYASSVWMHSCGRKVMQ